MVIGDGGRYKVLKYVRVQSWYKHGGDDNSGVVTGNDSDEPVSNK